jgi:hypothetical protein
MLAGRQRYFPHPSYTEPIGAFDRHAGELREIDQAADVYSGGSHLYFRALPRRKYAPARRNSASIDY